MISLFTFLISRIFIERKFSFCPINKLDREFMPMRKVNIEGSYVLESSLEEPILAQGNHGIFNKINNQFRAFSFNL